jgi:NADH:ubiquinone oxidoreductase subunit F (NADH-binding)
MTTTIEQAPGRMPVRTIGPARLLAGLDRTGRVDLALHHELHGALPRTGRAELEELAGAVGLRGRGGAAFPVASKLASLPARVYAVVVNGSESEPASHKDRALLIGVPHLVLDGAVVVAAAVGAKTVLFSLHAPTAAESVRAAMAERAGPVGVEVTVTPGVFVGGEARALLRGLSGGPALPPGRRVLPSGHGLHGRPTFLSNAETFAQLAVLVRYGARRYAETGLPAEPGTQLLTVSGAVRRPGVLEAPVGVPLDVVLGSAGAAAGPVLLGGYHGRWLAGSGGVVLSRLPGMAPVGAGVAVALGTETCPLGETYRVAAWLAGRSAGQCGPCVFGLPAVAGDLASLFHGEPADTRRHLALVDGRGACAHPDGAVRFVSSALDAFSADVQAHLAGGCGRPVIGMLPTGEQDR